MARWRPWVAAALSMSLAAAAAEPPRYAVVRPGVALAFPADHGAHPNFRTEWWYVTGWVETGDGPPVGFQVTFFRSRTASDPRNPSAFAPAQVLFAHAALSDPRAGRLVHDQRIGREGFGLVRTARTDLDIAIDDWTLKRQADGRFRTRVRGRDFSLDLVLAPTQPILLQGEGGYSRKGPAESQASHYYSLPQLKVSGRIQRGRKAQVVTGQAWMDREWSSTLLDPRAVGWDWVGINLADGGALMAFQIRDASGRPLWAGGSLRPANGAAARLAPDAVRFSTVRTWRSPRTRALYPVERELSVRLRGGERRWRVRPLFDDQELDSRAAGGPVYWEGAVAVEGGRGYLELTGYASPLKL